MGNEPLSGGWMQTFTGKPFWPLEPRVEDIDPEDIAHALGMLCRYGGHTDRFYSVAEHCVLMSYAVSEENALVALLHDATEAYVGDLIRPLKRLLPVYSSIEYHVGICIANRFGIDPDMPEEVKLADNRILLDERDALMKSPPLAWAVDEQVERLGVVIEGWSPPEAEIRYFTRLVELSGG